jgi:hypothetical protein
MPTRRRLAVVHTPMTGRPDAVTLEIGTWIAIEWTLRNSVEFTPGIELRPRALAKTLSSWIGRRLPRSKIEPRST